MMASEALNGFYVHFGLAENSYINAAVFTLISDYDPKMKRSSPSQCSVFNMHRKKNYKLRQINAKVAYINRSEIKKLCRLKDLKSDFHQMRVHITELPTLQDRYRRGGSSLPFPSPSLSPYSLLPLTFLHHPLSLPLLFPPFTPFSFSIPTSLPIPFNLSLPFPPLPLNPARRSGGAL